MTYILTGHLPQQSMYTCTNNKNTINKQTMQMKFQDWKSAERWWKLCRSRSRWSAQWQWSSCPLTVFECCIAPQAKIQKQTNTTTVITQCVGQVGTRSTFMTASLVTRGAEWATCCTNYNLFTHSWTDVVHNSLLVSILLRWNTTTENMFSFESTMQY